MQLCDNGIFIDNFVFVLSNKNNMYTFNEFVDTDTIYNNFVEYNSIISASPNNWKQIISLEAIKLVVK
jgi:hypothetical protein